MPSYTHFEELNFVRMEADLEPATKRRRLCPETSQKQDTTQEGSESNEPGSSAEVSLNTADHQFDQGSADQDLTEDFESRSNASDRLFFGTCADSSIEWPTNVNDTIICSPFDAFVDDNQNVSVYDANHETRTPVPFASGDDEHSLFPGLNDFFEQEDAQLSPKPESDEGLFELLADGCDSSMNTDEAATRTETQTKEVCFGMVCLRLEPESWTSLISKIRYQASMPSAIDLDASNFRDRLQQIS